MNSQFEPLEHTHYDIVSKIETKNYDVVIINHNMSLVCRALLDIVNREGCTYGWDDAVTIAENYLGINPENRS